MDEMLQYVITLGPSIVSVICMTLLALLGNKKIAASVINALDIIKGMRRTNEDQKDEIKKLVEENKSLQNIIKDYEKHFHKIEAELEDLVDEYQKLIFKEPEEEDLDSKNN